MYLFRTYLYLQLLINQIHRYSNSSKSNNLLSIQNFTFLKKKAELLFSILQQPASVPYSKSRKSRPHLPHYSIMIRINIIFYCTPS
jgi:hypothetical protein